MKITRESVATGKTRTLDLPITEEQYKAWENGAKIQVAMPNLSPDQREFIMTGIYDGEWEELFPDEEE